MEGAYTLLVTFPILPARPLGDGSLRKLTKRRAGSRKRPSTRHPYPACARPKMRLMRLPYRQSSSGSSLPKREATMKANDVWEELYQVAPDIPTYHLAGSPLPPSPHSASTPETNSIAMVSACRPLLNDFVVHIISGVRIDKSALKTSEHC